MQFDLTEFAQKDVIVLGKNKESSVFEAFIQKYAAIRSYLLVEEVDEATISHKISTVNLEQTIVVKTSDVPSRLLKIPYTTPTNVFFKCTEQLRSRTVGVCGTWGKSTTAALIGHMFQQSGIQALVSIEGEKSPLELLENSSDNTYFVIELTSKMLDGLVYSPNIVVLTTLDKENIDYHGNLEAYWGVHQKLIEKLDESKLLIYDPTNEIALHWIAGKNYKNQAIDSNEQVDMNQSNLIGDFNKRNYLMARSAATSMGADRIACQNALRNFQPLPHRMQRVRNVKGITFIDDAESKSAKITKDEIMSCIRQIGPVGCVMLGGLIDDAEEFESLINTISTLMIPKLVLFPPLSEDEIRNMLPERYNPEIFVVDDMVKAVNWAASHTPSGSICLLSTAGDTSNIWVHADEKGNQFQYAVNSLSN